MKRRTQHGQNLTIAAPRHGARKSVPWRLSLGLAVLGVCCALSGCDGWMGDEAGVGAGASKVGSGQKSAYIERKVGSTYEGIWLNPDGTYKRTVVDSWGHGHQHEGTWRGYGGSLQNGKSQVSSRLELDSYTDTRDMIGSGSATPAPKTKTLSAGDFYLK